MREKWVLAWLLLGVMAMPGICAGKKGEGPQPKHFDVKYDRGAYEKVMTADQYRQELMKTENDEREPKDVYFDRARELYEKARLENESLIYGFLSDGFLHLWALTDPYLARRKRLAVEARDRFIRAVGLNRFCYDAYYYLAVLDVIDKDWDSAKTNLREYIRSENDDSYYHLLLGYIYASEKGRIPEKAEEEFRLAEERATDPVAVKWAVSQTKGKQRPRGLPPIKAPQPPRKQYFPRSVSMNIHVPEFVNKTGHEELEKLPGLLSSRISEAIFRNNRFTLIETHTTGAEESAFRGLDSVFLGSIINADLTGRVLLCDIKVIYPDGGNILFSRQFEIPYRDTPMLSIPDRDINRIVGELEKNFIKCEGSVIQVSREYVTVNLGIENGLRPGYKGLVLEKASPVILPHTKERITTETYLGEVLFEQIEETVSKARILNAGRVTIEVGDVVRTK